MQLETPLHPKSHIARIRPLLPKKYSPLRKSGDGIQSVYLAEVPAGLAILLLELLGQAGNTVVLSPSSPDGPSADELLKTTAQVDKAQYFSPASLKDEREKKLREIVARRGQPDFRNKLIAAYDGRCTVTNCDAVAALEAAHIVPYIGPQSNHVTNGLLLRADIHTVFDLDLIGIDPDSLTVSLAPAISSTVYADLQGKKLHLPASPLDHPNQEALVQRWKRFCGEAGRAHEAHLADRA
jgi:hypothetical protein